MDNMVRNSPFWPSREVPDFSRGSRVVYKPPGYYRQLALKLRKATLHVRHLDPRIEDLEYRYMELERKACRAAERYSPPTFPPSPTQVEEHEVANVLDDLAASSPVCDMADEEVILVPRPGRWQEYLNPPIDAYDAMSALPSPAASTVSRDVTSPAQASSPFNVIQFNVAPNKVSDRGTDIEVDSSPYSEYSTPSTAIPSPYNKLNRGAFPPVRRYDPASTSTQSRVVTHAPTSMTYVDWFGFAGTPAPPTHLSKAGGSVMAGSPLPPKSRWSKAPQDLPKDYFGGPGFAPVRPSTLARFSHSQTMTPHHTASPMAQNHPPIGYWEASMDRAYPYPTGYPEPQEPPLLPRPLTDRSEWHHRVAHLDENGAMALAFWFSGLIVNRLAYPNAAAFNPKHPRFKQGRRCSGRFDPYDVVLGHSYADGHIVVAPELAHHMYQVIHRIKTAEPFMAAIYFLDRLPLHDVDGLYGSEFRTHLVPRHAGDVRYAVERRVAAIIISLAHNTLEDRDFHLPNSMMWEIGAMDKTRFNILKLRALQDLNWDVHITSEDWRRHIKDAGIALYPADPCCSTAIVALEPEYREMLARAFSFMWNAANHLSWAPESPAPIPAAVSAPPMSRESSAQGPNYGHHYTPVPKARDFAYDARGYPFEYNEPSPHQPRDFAYVARDYHSGPTHVASSAHSSRDYAYGNLHSHLSSNPTPPAPASRDYAYGNLYSHASSNPTPPAPAFQAAGDANPPLEEVYVTRTASQEARARRARDAYMAEQEARARHAAEAREHEAQAQREKALALEEPLGALVSRHADVAAVSELSPEHPAAPGRHRREVTKQMRTQELRAKRARALYLQRTHGQKSRNMILA